MSGIRIMLGPPCVRLAIVLSCASFFSNVLGQSEPSTSTEAQEADEELNRNYQQAMRSLPPKSQEELRKAQRAWLVFVEENSAAIRAAARKQGLPLNRCEKLELEEVRDRARDLSTLPYSRTRADETTDETDYRALIAPKDAELNAVYQRCLHSLGPEEAEKLREAQRAWIAFYDASRYRGVQILYAVTAGRVQQLNDFYIGTGDLNGSTDEEKALPEEEQQADSTTPDPFERAR